MSVRFLSKFGTVRGTYDVAHHQSADGKRDNLHAKQAVPLIGGDDVEIGYPCTPQRGQHGRSSGFYNVTLARKKNNRDEFPAIVEPSNTVLRDNGSDSIKRCLCVLVGFLILAIVMGILVFVYLNRPTLDDSLVECAVYGDNGTDVSLYAQYLKSKPTHRVANLCDGFALFVRHHRKIAELKSRPNSVQFGYTSFADLELEQNTKGDLNSLFNRSEVPSTISNRNITNWGNSNAQVIALDDKCSMIWQMRNVMTQWYDILGGESGVVRMKKNSYKDEICGEKELLELNELEFSSSLENTVNQQKRLLQLGPFITTISVPESFFFYKSGIFGKSLCEMEEDLLFVRVVVFGYDDAQNSGNGYWYMQPIGENFKDWGENGVIKYQWNASCEINHIVTFPVLIS